MPDPEPEPIPDPGVDPDPDPDRRRKRKRGCEYLAVCPHRGGNDHHNWCADNPMKNVEIGCDVRVRGKLFDGLRIPRVIGNLRVEELFEVKTDAWSTYSAWLKSTTLAAHIREALFEHGIAADCGYPFVFAVSDRELLAALKSLRRLVHIDFQYIADCDRTRRP